MTKILLSTSIVLAAFASCICDRTFNNQIYDNQIIDETGVFPLSNGQLIVEYRRNGIVDFKLLKGHVAVINSGSGYSFSRYMKWCLFWESDSERLWVASGDVGCSVYAKSTDNRYRFFEIAPVGAEFADEGTTFSQQEVPVEVRNAINQKFGREIIP